METKFEAKVQVELMPEAKGLVDIYENTFGSTGPGCCPEALAAVLDHLVEFYSIDDLRYLANNLRGR
jgi:hypothetical protein